MNKILVLAFLFILGGCSSSSDEPGAFVISPTKLDEVGLVHRDNPTLAMTGASYVGTEVISLANTLPVAVDNISVSVPDSVHYTVISSDECNKSTKDTSVSYKVMPNSVCRIKLLGAFDEEMQEGEVRNANITIKYLGNTMVIPLKVTFMKVPDIQVNDGEEDMGNAKLSAVSDWFTVTYTNMSAENYDNMSFGSIIGLESGFEIQHFEHKTTCDRKLVAGATCDLTVRFSPKAIKKHFQSYGFFVKNTQIMDYVPLNGDVVTRVFGTNGIGYNHDMPAVIATPAILNDFVITGNSAEGKINLYNDCDIMLNDLSISIISDDGRFSLLPEKSSCDPDMLFFEDCTFAVDYNTENAEKGLKRATVVITGSNAPETVSIPVVFDYK